MLHILTHSHHQVSSPCKIICDIISKYLTRRSYTNIRNCLQNFGVLSGGRGVMFVNACAQSTHSLLYFLYFLINYHSTKTKPLNFEFLSANSMSRIIDLCCQVQLKLQVNLFINISQFLLFSGRTNRSPCVSTECYPKIFKQTLDLFTFLHHYKAHPACNLILSLLKQLSSTSIS